MMTALYRRYRPDTFEDVIGQEHVTKALQAALANGRVNHAYLFSGPRGCGKTTSARILARCLNCAQGPTATPCGTCDSCRDLATGGPGSLDVIEIDAASHGGVDDTRELRDRAVYAPARDRFKIFIIDEAHNVSKEGFNALLKLVEEPPDHIKFIFATTNPEKVISTIRSRTHHYPFRLVAPEVLRDYMADLCHSEGVTAEDGVLGLVVRAGGGSVRDSLSILDQLIAGEAEPKLHYDRAVSLLGYTDSALLSAMVDALVSGSGADAYTVVDRMIQTGHEPRRFVEDLLQYLRDLVVMKLAGAGAGAVLGDLPEAELASMRPQVAALNGRTLTRCAELVDTGLTEMVGATSPRLALELLVAKLLMATSTEGSASTVPEATKATGSCSRDSGGPVPQVTPVRAEAPSQGASTIAVAGSADPATPPDASVRPEASAPQPAPVSSPQREKDTVSQPEPTVAPRAEKWEFKPTPWNISGENTDSTASTESRVPNTPSGQTPAQRDNPADQSAPVSNPASAPAPDFTPSAPNPAPAPVRVSAPAPAQGAQPAQSGTGTDANYEKIRSNWGKIMARLKQDHAATGNLLETHGQLQGMRGSTVDIAFPNPGLARAFGERHTSALAAVIQGFAGLNVEVRAVLAGFGAPAAKPAAKPEPSAAGEQQQGSVAQAAQPPIPPEEFPAPSEPADFVPELPQHLPEPPGQSQSLPATPATVSVAEPEPPVSAAQPPAATPNPTSAVPSEEPAPVISTTPRDSNESGEPRKQTDSQISGEMKAGIQTAQAMLGGTIIDPKTAPGSPYAKAGRR